MTRTTLSAVTCSENVNTANPVAEDDAWDLIAGSVEEPPQEDDFFEA